MSALLRQAQGPWEHVAAASAGLAPEELERLVPDASERARVASVRPRLGAVRPPTERAAEVLREVVTAQDAHEIAWYTAHVEALLTLCASRSGPGAAVPKAPDTAAPAPDPGDAGAPGLPARVPPRAWAPRQMLLRSGPGDAPARITAATAPLAVGVPVAGGIGAAVLAGSVARRAEPARPGRVVAASASGRGSAGYAIPGDEPPRPGGHARAGLLGRLRGRRSGDAVREDVPPPEADSEAGAGR